MDIRGNSSDISKLRKAVCKEVKASVAFSVEDDMDEPVLMALQPNQDGKQELRQFAKGMEAAKAYVHFGYDRITRYCPLLKKKCIGEKCQFYIVQGATEETRTGDCAVVWNFWKSR